MLKYVCFPKLNNFFCPSYYFWLSLSFLIDVSLFECISVNCGLLWSFLCYLRLSPSILVYARLFWGYPLCKPATFGSLKKKVAIKKRPLQFEPHFFCGLKLPTLAVSRPRSQTTNLGSLMAGFQHFGAFVPQTRDLGSFTAAFQPFAQSMMRCMFLNCRP